MPQLDGAEDPTINNDFKIDCRIVFDFYNQLLFDRNTIFYLLAITFIIFMTQTLYKFLQEHGFRNQNVCLKYFRPSNFICLKHTHLCQQMEDGVHGVNGHLVHNPVTVVCSHVIGHVTAHHLKMADNHAAAKIRIPGPVIQQHVQQRVLNNTARFS